MAIIYYEYYDYALPYINLLLTEIQLRWCRDLRAFCDRHPASYAWLSMDMEDINNCPLRYSALQRTYHRDIEYYFYVGSLFNVLKSFERVLNGSNYKRDQILVMLNRPRFGVI